MHSTPHTPYRDQCMYIRPSLPLRASLCVCISPQTSAPTLPHPSATRRFRPSVVLRPTEPEAVRVQRMLQHFLLCKQRECRPLSGIRWRLGALQRALWPREPDKECAVHRCTHWRGPGERVLSQVMAFCSGSLLARPLCVALFCAGVFVHLG